MKKMPTASSKFLPFHHLFVVAITFNFFVVYSSPDPSASHELSETVLTILIWNLCRGGRGVGLRGLKSFKETATGTNVTFDCSPSGPCVPCLYSEKKDVSYRCSETGYRIPMRCEKSVDENKKRKVKEDSSSTEVESEMYVTYRSCIPAVNEEKLSVLGFEALMLVLLMSSWFVILRRKGGLGAIRLPTNANPRF
ncbi:hypothetical protein SSX86_017290 [Deinandra increscens subsp. villosa]|uniref:Uncharacterized protein n=1 Tax=Deinandra increscens subsp. villosa TaxID=3103831 RepID=A0AAP0GYE1_9ASTR